jgi:hypothetical protein
VPHGNIDADVALTKRGNGLMVCGPIVWAGSGGDVAAGKVLIQLVMVTKLAAAGEDGPLVGIGHHTDFFEPPEPEWMKTVRLFPPGVAPGDPLHVVVTAIVYPVSSPPAAVTVETWDNVQESVPIVVP